MKIGLSLLLLCSFVLIGWSQSEVPQQLRTDVVYLASDYLEGREAGKPGEAMAAAYIAWRMEEIGLTPAGTEGGFEQVFDFKFNPNPHATDGEARTGRNVIGFLDNGATHTVVLGAHFDHLGYGAAGSLYTGEPAIHNGADDNASGVAAMLHLAAMLKAGKASGHNFLFIAFSAEELGLIGSKYFTNNPTIPLAEISYMINMDMVGRLNAERSLAINGVGTSPAFRPVLEELAVADIQTVLDDSGVGPSDYTAFYLKDIPVLSFFTGQHRDYHKPIDDSALINFPGLVAVSDYILAVIDALDDKGKLEFTETKNDNQGRQAAAFKVSLGVMPDYVHDGSGMRVDSVIGGRPADKAGIQDGDVIIAIGDLVVEDIYDYMEGLANFKTGETATVKVLRDGEELSFEVTF